MAQIDWRRLWLAAVAVWLPLLLWSFSSRISDRVSMVQQYAELSALLVATALLVVCTLVLVTRWLRRRFHDLRLN